MEITGSLRSVWDELVDTISELIAMLIDFRRAAPRANVKCDEAGLLCGVQEEDVDSLPLAGAHCTLHAPESWFFHARLAPAPIESIPFLEAFATQQIERATPWRTNDVYAYVGREPVSEDPSRVQPILTVIPKRLVEGPVASLAQRGCARVSLAVPGSGAGESLDLYGAGKTTISRAFVAGGLAASVAATLALALSLWWAAGSARARAAAVESRLAATRHRLELLTSRDASTSSSELLRPPVVAIIDQLSAILPDGAYLTSLSVDGDKLIIAGVARNPPQLVPILERSGKFSNVAFLDATRNEPNGSSFRLAMRVGAKSR